LFGILGAALGIVEVDLGEQGQRRQSQHAQNDEATIYMPRFSQTLLITLRQVVGGFQQILAPRKMREPACLDSTSGCMLPRMLEMAP
jgi:hypothetical protein